MIFFSIQTIPGSGLGDQLGTQFSRLYYMGKALGWNYVYRPVSFFRSTKPLWYKILQKIFFAIRFFLFFISGKNLFSTGINILLLKFEKIANRYASGRDESTLSEYLGLSHLSQGNIEFPEIKQVIELPLATIFQDHSVVKFDNFGTLIKLMIPECNQCLICLSWTDLLWELIPKIDQILAGSIPYPGEIPGNLFSEGYWKVNRKTKEEKKRIVFHIRCGDSTTIDLNSRKLFVYDKFLFSSDDEMEKIHNIDPHRKSVSPDRFLEVYDKIKERVNSNLIEYSIVTDGFELTWQHILRNLLKRRSSIQLTSEEKARLRKQICSGNKVFQSFSDARLIVGESKQNLLNSIHSLAEADVLIWGCGGFAVNTHALFKKYGKRSLVVNINDFNDKTIEEIDQFIHA